MQNNEGDHFIRCRNITHVSGKIDNLKLGDKLKKLKQRLTELVGEETEINGRQSCENKC